MPEILDATTALRLLEEVVADFGEDYIDPTSDENGGACSYWEGNMPGCIVGQVLHRHGYSDLDLQCFDAWGAVGIDENWPDILLEGGASILSAAQVLQDTGHSWGEALKAARSAYMEVHHA